MISLFVLLAFIVGVPAGLLVWWAVHSLGKRRQAHRERRGFAVRTDDDDFDPRSDG